MFAERSPKLSARPNAGLIRLVAGERYHLYRTTITWPRNVR
jgi:hypothetical protein